MTVTFNLTLKLLVSVLLGHNNSRKETESYRLVFPASTKREIRHFHAVVEQRRLRKVQKNLMHLSATFDTVDIDVLLGRLENELWLQALLYFGLRLISLTDLNAFLSTRNSFAI